MADTETTINWRRIETAPTDGRRIMLCIEGTSSEYNHLASWDGEACYPYIPNNWTHWMPIPVPPEGH